jgi:hypothetical protein
MRGRTIDAPRPHAGKSRNGCSLDPGLVGCQPPLARAARPGRAHRGSRRRRAHRGGRRPPDRDRLSATRTLGARGAAGPQPARHRLASAGRHRDDRLLRRPAQAACRRLHVQRGPADDGVAARARRPGPEPQRHRQLRHRAAGDRRPGPGHRRGAVRPRGQPRRHGRQSARRARASRAGQHAAPARDPRRDEQRPGSGPPGPADVPGDGHRGVRRPGGAQRVGLRRATRAADPGVRRQRRRRTVQDRGVRGHPAAARGERHRVRAGRHVAGPPVRPGGRTAHGGEPETSRCSAAGSPRWCCCRSRS